MVDSHVLNTKIRSPKENNSFYLHLDDMATKIENKTPQYYFRAATVAIYLLWAIPTLLFIAFFSTLLEAMWKVKIPDYAMNVTAILALVVLHYFKFREN